MDNAGVAVGLATISIVGAAILFAAERVHTGPMDFIEPIWVFHQTVAMVQLKF